MIVRRVALAVPMIVVVSFLIFALVDLAPGDAAERLAPENATLAQMEQLRERLQLDDPLPSRYLAWASDAIKGDFGTSLATGERVSDLIFGARLAVTLSLAAVALVVTFILSLALGVLAAARKGGITDRVTVVMSAALVAAPPFWLAMVLVLNFALHQRFFGIDFPAVGYYPLSEGFWTWINSLALPALALAAMPTAELTLLLRASLIEELERDYVLAARAKGVRPLKVLLKHALKNAAIPVVTTLGARIAQLLGGAVVIETVFAIRGLGTLTISSVLTQDLPVLLGLVVQTTIVVLLVNMLVDISYGYFNPKVRHS
jgi:peptide/nickel transport system permease protein